MNKEEWLERYKKTMINQGLNEREAEAITKAVQTDPEFLNFLNDNPEQAAYDELSYWANDE